MIVKVRLLPTLRGSDQIRSIKVGIQMSVKVRPLPKLTGSDHIQSVKVGMAKKRSIGNYFGFRWLITPTIIKILHVLGLIILNLAMIGAFITGIIVLVVGSTQVDLEGTIKILAIIGFIIVGFIAFFLVNLLWRMICENIILFFSIHEMISGIERTTGDIEGKVAEPEEETEEDED